MGNALQHRATDRLLLAKTRKMLAQPVALPQFFGRGAGMFGQNPRGVIEGRRIKPRGFRRILPVHIKPGGFQPADFG